MKLGFCHILTLIFVIAKLTNYIDWSWWWVFAPLIIGTVLTFLIVFVATIGVAISGK